MPFFLLLRLCWSSAICHPAVSDNDNDVQDANAAQIEQMNGNCAVCWSSMSLTDDCSSSSRPTSPAVARAEEEEDDQQGIAMAQFRPQGFMEVPFNIQSTHQSTVFARVKHTAQTPL